MSISIKHIFHWCLTLLIQPVTAQTIQKEKLYYWSEEYSNGIVGNKGYEIDLIDSSETSLFIKGALSSNNTLLSDKYLALPDEKVLKLICQQKTAKEIGELLFISPKTVEGHRNSLFVKTGVKNVVGLVIYALQHNIIGIDDLPVIGS